jgi:hypothetical protein
MPRTALKGEISSGETIGDRTVAHPCWADVRLLFRGSDRKCPCAALVAARALPATGGSRSSSSDEGRAGPPSPGLQALGFRELVGICLLGQGTDRFAICRAGVPLLMGLIHDGADRGGAAPALRAAAEGAVHLGRGAGAVRAGVEAGTHLPVREDIARANDHGNIQFGIASSACTSRQLGPMPTVVPTTEYTGGAVEAGCRGCLRQIKALCGESCHRCETTGRLSCVLRVRAGGQ